MQELRPRDVLAHGVVPAWKLREVARRSCGRDLALAARDPFLARFDALPAGGFDAKLDGVRWVCAKSAFAGGRSFRFVAEEVTGAIFLSANLYRFVDGTALLKPCEITAAPIVDFVLRARPLRSVCRASA